MRKSIIGAAIVSCALALTLSVQAQEGQKKEGEKKKGGGEHTMTGCVQKAEKDAKMFTIANTAEKGPKTIVILESKESLAPHAGHKIDFTGTAVQAKEAESMKPAPPKGDHYMKVTAIKMVSATCP